MKKQKGFIPPMAGFRRNNNKCAGFTFLELIVSMLILTMVCMVVLGMFAHGSLALKKSSQLSIAGLLAQSVMERTIYQSLDEIETNSVTGDYVNFPTDKKWVNKRWKDFKYKVETISGSGELANFKKVKVTVKTPLGSEIAMVGLKRTAGGVPDGTLLVAINPSYVDISTLYLVDINNPSSPKSKPIYGGQLPSSIPYQWVGQNRVVQAKFSRDGEYIFILGSNGTITKQSVNAVWYESVDLVAFAVSGWFDLSSTADEIVYTKMIPSTPTDMTPNKCVLIKKNYKDGTETTIPVYESMGQHIAANPVFSPNGDKIAFVTYRCVPGSQGELATTKLYIYEKDERGNDKLTPIDTVTASSRYGGASETPQGFSYSKPLWSPDGTKITYSLRYPIGNYAEASAGCKGCTLYYKPIEESNANRQILANQTPLTSPTQYCQVPYGYSCAFLDEKKIALIAMGDPMCENNTNLIVTQPYNLIVKNIETGREEFRKNFPASYSTAHFSCPWYFGDPPYLGIFTKLDFLGYHSKSDKLITSTSGCPHIITLDADGGSEFVPLFPYPLEPMSNEQAMLFDVYNKHK